MTIYKVTYTYPNGTRGEVVDRFANREDAQATIEDLKKVWLQSPPSQWHVVTEPYDPAYFDKWHTSLNSALGHPTGN